MENVNVVVITGNLTCDPELRSTGGGTSVCEMRVAVNTRRKDGQSGQWYDKPNYFDVVVFGARGESCATYLAKGRPIRPGEATRCRDGLHEGDVIEAVGDIGPERETAHSQEIIVSEPVRLRARAGGA